MNSISIVFVLFNCALVSADALLVDGSQLEANQGETVTLPFTMEKAEKADRLRITFTSETKQKRLIAQHCDPSDGCAVVNTPGVSLIVGEGRVCVTLQRVNSSRSGIYEAQAFFGEDVCALKATLVVHEASFSSTIAPPHSSTPKPLTSDLLWLLTFLTIPLVILGAFASGNAGGQIPCFQKKELGSSSSDCVAVAVNGCEENAESLLTDTRVT